MSQPGSWDVHQENTPVVQFYDPTKYQNTQVGAAPEGGYQIDSFSKSDPQQIKNQNSHSYTQQFDCGQQVQANAWNSNWQTNCNPEITVKNQQPLNPGQNIQHQLPLNRGQNIQQNQQFINTGQNLQQNQQPLNAGQNLQQNQQPLNAGQNLQQNQQPLNAGQNLQQNQQPLNAGQNLQQNQQLPKADQNQQPLNAGQSLQQNQQQPNEGIHQRDQWQTWDPTRQLYWQDQTWGERGDLGNNLALGHSGVPNVQQNWNPQFNPNLPATQNVFPVSSQNEYTAESAGIHSSVAGIPQTSDQSYQQGFQGNNFFQPNNVTDAQDQIVKNSGLSNSPIPQSAPASTGQQSYTPIPGYQQNSFPLATENSAMSNVQKSDSFLNSTAVTSQQQQLSANSSQLEDVTDQGTVAGFFCKDDDIIENRGHNYFGVDPKLQTNITDGSQNVNVSSQYPVKNVEHMSEQFDGMTLGSNSQVDNSNVASSNLGLQSAVYGNTNRSALITSEKDCFPVAEHTFHSEEDQQASALNDWEVIPRETSENSISNMAKDNVLSSTSAQTGTFIPSVEYFQSSPNSKNSSQTTNNFTEELSNSNSVFSAPDQQSILPKTSPLIFNPDPAKVSSPLKSDGGVGLNVSSRGSSRESQSQQPPLSDSSSQLFSKDGENKNAVPIPPVSLSSTVTDSQPARTRADHRARHLSGQRQHASAFHPVPSHTQHSVSPTTTASLWDNLEPPSTGIILAPAAPLTNAETSTMATTTTSSVLPVIPMSDTLETKLKQTNTTTKKENGKNIKKQNSSSKMPMSEGMSERYKASIRRSSRDSLVREDDNRSINSLEELDGKLEYRDGDVRYREWPGSRYDDGYDRPTSRTRGYRDYPRHHYRVPQDYYPEPYYDEKYERPRSRHDQVRPSSRPSSTSLDESNQLPADNREQQYRHWDRYRGYYNYQGQRHYDDYYYRYYQHQDARYTSAYYDELSNYSRYGQAYDPRYSEYYSQYPEEQYRPRDQSQSRGNTPAIDETGRQSADYYGHHSRSSSRHGYTEAEYQQQGYGPYAYDNYAYGYDAYYNQAGYPYDYYQQAEKATGRLTPQKHTIPHVRATFGPNGHLIKVLPNSPADGQPALVHIEEIGTMLSDRTEAEDLKVFPGPLTQMDTHKTDVLRFCQQKSRQCLENMNLSDRESAQLMWRLLERLIKQNGTIIGTDVAELLLEDHEPSTHEYSMIGLKISRSLDELDVVDDDDESENTAHRLKSETDRTLVTRSTVLEEATDRFRNLVLYGRKKDALECAMKNHLWGHALFLASKMDNRTHANVMTRFANSAMKMNDPLQTLYQLMSGRQPAAVTCVADERWGDWRPHLAMILSNHSSKPELDRKSISLLGDTLAAKGYLFASHFCYIMAQTGFGTFNKKTSKLVLIGSSHNTTLEQFVTNEAIQCTEVYEYAQSLSNSSFFLPHFQVYKFVYAARLAEYGFPQEALHYCEVISTAVQHSPAWFQPTFVKVLYEMANRLKFYDPQRQQEGDDAEDAPWLQHLYRICVAYDDGSIQPMSGNVTPVFLAGTSASSDSGDVNYTGVHDYGTTLNPQEHQNIVYTSQQQISNHSLHNTTDIQSSVYNTHWQNQHGNSHEYQSQNQTADQSGVTEYQSASSYTSTGFPTPNTQASTQIASDPMSSHRGSFDQFAQDVQTPHGQYSDRLHSQRSSVASVHSVDVNADQVFDPSQNNSQESSAFDYFGAATGQIVAPPSRFRTTSESSSVTASGGGRHRTMSGSSTGSVKAAHSGSSKPGFSMSATVKEEKTSQKSSDKNSKGWFSGIFGWKSGRKNEMILPDDKKPTIVWDEEKKRWLNTEESAEDTQTLDVKPPKDTELMGNMQGSGGSEMMSSAGNRFSRPKGKGARNQYVDVLNPKPTGNINVPSSLFNVMPTSDTPPPAQIFNPLNASSANQTSAPTGVQSEDQTTYLEPPSQDEHVSRSSSMSSLSREVAQLTAQPTSAAPPASLGPVLFNPSQFENKQPSKQATGMKYGQRRQYPK